MIIRFRLLPLLPVLLGCSFAISAQTFEHPNDLYVTIKSLDAKLFDAYNS